MTTVSLHAALQERGFMRLDHGFDDAAAREMEDAFRALGQGRAGHRAPPRDVVHLAAVARVRARLGPAARPVRALLFDKTETNNWSLGWHQDRTIEVQARIDTAGFGPWTLKQGRHHVAPPIALLQAMVTVRFHLDPVESDNAPLLVAPGSHRLGLIAESEIDPIVARCGIEACLAVRGDVWLYATPILHASQSAVRPRHRRVLQVDFAAEPLPNGLEWAALA